MDGVRLPGIWSGEACPNPFRTAPSPFLVKAQKYFDAPAGFNGRIGALVFEKDGALYAHCRPIGVTLLPIFCGPPFLFMTFRTQNFFLQTGRLFPSVPF